MENSFIVQFFRKWKEVGAVSPSSIFLIEDMLSQVDFDKAELIVELGAGSGSFTRNILSRMRPNAKLVVFEINEAFVRKLSLIKDSRIAVIKDSAVNISKYLGSEKADYIVSGIPLSNLDMKTKVGIISGAKENLKLSGIFLQFQYFPESFSLLKRHFSIVKLKFTFLNPPPAFFYICR